MNLVKRDCPGENCNNTQADVQGVIIRHNEKTGDESFTHYRCLKCKINYGVPRKENTEEQKLTQRFVDASKIILNSQ